MSRGRVLALVSVVVLLLGALVVGLRPTGSDDGPLDPVERGTSSDLTALRAEADLPPCPSGVGAAFDALSLPCLGAEGEVDLSAPGPGRPALVNVWATWCGPCVREVPLLQQVALEGAGKVDVLGVLTQDTPENGLQFAADPAIGGMDYPSVVDDEGVVMREYGTGAPPVTLFVTADGEIAHRQVGEITSREQLDALLAEHLGVRL